MKNFIALMMLMVTILGCVFTPPVNKSVTIEPSDGKTEPASWKKIEALSPERLLKDEDPLLMMAKKQLAVPYVYGGMSSQGFDCSGFVSYVYAMGVGVLLPRTAKAQSTFGRIIDMSDLYAGDMVMFDTDGDSNVNHSGIYIGEGYFIHASSGKGEVTISKLDDGFYHDAFTWGVRVEY